MLKWKDVKKLGMEVLTVDTSWERDRFLVDVTVGVGNQERINKFKIWKWQVIACWEVSIELSRSLNSLSKKSLINQSINWIVKTQPICQDFLRVSILLSIHLSWQGYINSQERMTISLSKHWFFCIVSIFILISILTGIDTCNCWDFQAYRKHVHASANSIISVLMQLHLHLLYTVFALQLLQLLYCLRITFCCINEIGVFCFENEQVFYVL
jgi:hypothetical protein